MSDLVAAVPVNSELAIAVAVASLCVSGVAIITFWMKINNRISEADASAEAANRSASMAIARVIETEKQLVDHRVKVAAEYVSKEMLNDFRSELLGAINRLSDQVVSLFKAPH
jgi:hypothetical protein